MLKVFLVGRVAIEADGLAIEAARFPGRQGRLLFAYLVSGQGRPIPRDELAQVLWGDVPPATWDKALTVLVSKLRAMLGEAGLDGAQVLTAAFGCYRLDLPETCVVDVGGVAVAIREAELARGAGDYQTAMGAAGLAETVTRRQFLPGDSGTWVDSKRRELADIRARALHCLAEACLESGAPRDAAGWAELAIEVEPFRESGYRLLMQAHADAGNRAEALRVYERCRRLLDEELGAYPSPETESIYRHLLEVPAPLPPAPAPAPAPARETGEPTAASTSDAEPKPSGERRPSARRQRSRVRSAVVLATAAVVVAGVVVTTVVVASVGEKSQLPVRANSIVALTPAGTVSNDIDVGSRPVAITSVAGSLWVANLDDNSVTRIDLSTHAVLRSIPVGAAPTSLTVADGHVWVIDAVGDIELIDPQYNQATTLRRLASYSVGDSNQQARWPMLAAFGFVWVVDPDGYVERLDPKSGRELDSVDVGDAPSAIAAGDGSVWVTNGADGTVTRIAPQTSLATTIPVGHDPAAIAVNAAGAWVADAGTNTLVRIDPNTNAITYSTAIGDEPTSVLATSTALWVANGRDGTVLRLDPRAGRVTRTMRLGGTPSALAYVSGRIWVGIAPADPPVPASGGTLRLTLQNDLPLLDPAVAMNQAAQLFYATCANLVTYPDKPAPAGSQIVPDAAEAVPAPSDGGRTYTFTIRPGYRFSPPSNQAVTAQTFKSTIERVANPRLRSPLASEFSNVVGYDAYAAGRADALQGVVAQGSTLTVQLAHPDGAFLADLAEGAACAVPVGTPVVPGGLSEIPSAGPYYVASQTPRQQIVLRRNPNYHGERPHRFDEIVVTIGVASSRALSEVEGGTADYALDGPPRDAGPLLEARYGPESKAAQDGRQQYFINSANAVRWLHMNTSRPLFANVGLRRAVNYAIDRAMLVAQGRQVAEANPFNAGVASDDYLPPAMAGAPDFQSYPLAGPELARAKQLAGHLHATAIMYTPSEAPWLQEAAVVRADLRPLGIDVEVKQFPLEDFYSRITTRGEPFDLAISGWGGGNADPASLLNVFDGTTITATDNSNLSYFNNPNYDQQLHAAAQLTGPARYRAYAKLELQLERDFVPAAPFAIDASRDFFSARIGCQVYQPVYGIDLSALCVRP